MRYFIVFLVVLGLCSCGNLSKSEFELLSPDEGISLSVGVDAEGIIRYNIHHGDELLVSKAALGIVVDSLDFTQNVMITSASKSSFSEVWEPVWGQFSEIENSYNQLDLIVSKEAGQSLKVVFRLFNDGIGFRYELPGEGEAVISQETTQFNMASDNAAWWVAPCWENDEYIYQNTKLSEVTVELRNQSAPEGHASHFACETGFNTPVTMKTPEGTDRKSTRLNSSHVRTPYAVFCLKKKTTRTLIRSPAGGSRARIRSPSRSAGPASTPGSGFSSPGHHSPATSSASRCLPPPPPPGP